MVAARRDSLHRRGAQDLGRKVRQEGSTSERRSDKGERRPGGAEVIGARDRARALDREGNVPLQVGQLAPTGCTHLAARSTSEVRNRVTRWRSRSWTSSPGPGDGRRSSPALACWPPTFPSPTSATSSWVDGHPPSYDTTSTSRSPRSAGPWASRPTSQGAPM